MRGAAVRRELTPTRPRLAIEEVHANVDRLLVESRMLGVEAGDFGLLNVREQRPAPRAMSAVSSARRRPQPWTSRVPATQSPMDRRSPSPV